MNWPEDFLDAHERHWEDPSSFSRMGDGPTRITCMASLPNAA